MEAPATSTASATCVHCSAALQLSTHESVEVLACPASHGVFIHAASLQIALQDRTADRPEHEERAAELAQSTASTEQLDADEAGFTCPTCGQPMSKRIYAYESGVVVDVCSEHGIWLDDSELHRIEAWYEAQERHREEDERRWGGQGGELERIEQQFEREQAAHHRAVHWGPVGMFLEKTSYMFARRDD